MTDDPTSLEAVPEGEMANLPAQMEQRAFHGAVPNLPHENEPDFIILREKLAEELTGDGLRFGHYIAHEATVSRWNIARYNEALLAGLREDPRGRPRRPGPIDLDDLRERLAGRRRSEPPRTVLEPLSQLPSAAQLQEEIDPLIDIETRRFYENIDLIDRISQNHQLLRMMEQNVNEKQKSKSGLQVERTSKPKSEYLTDDNKLTRLSHIILNEPPLLNGESRRDYERLLLDAIEFCRGEIVTEIIAAQDIANGTWQIHRLLALGEQTLQSAFSLAEGRMRERRHQALTWIGGRNEQPLLPACPDDNLIDPGVLLAEALHERLDRLKNTDRQIDIIRRRRRRIIENVLMRRGSRLRFSSATSRGRNLIT